MTSRSPLRIASLAAVAALLPLTAGCASLGGGKGPDDTGYIARDAESLYAAAKERLDRGDVKVAAALFDDLIHDLLWHLLKVGRLHRVAGAAG